MKQEKQDTRHDTNELKCLCVHGKDMNKKFEATAFQNDF